jgi:UDP-N-acetyl-D-mannosaminuronic acid dehydrogenase
MAEHPFNRICVVGLGYVGLPTAALIATRGIDVLGVDTSATAVDRVNKGKAPPIEPELSVMVKGATASGKLRAAAKPEPADAFIVAVPTPVANDHKPDLTHLEAAAASIAPVLKPGDLVVTESTVPVGTTEAFSGWMAGHRPDLSFAHAAGDKADILVAHSPERVLPGRILLELVDNDRVVGGVSPKSGERAAELYRLFVRGTCVVTDARTAELVKLAENAYRDVNIAFANELAAVGETLEVDARRVIELANLHPRVNILNPGPGVGGHCIAVDPWFIVESAPDETPLIRAARGVNDGVPARVVAKIAAKSKERRAKTVACLGLAYKADIDDLRMSPAINVVHGLAGAGFAEVMVVEPHVTALPGELAGMPGVRLVALDEALGKAEILVLLTDHRAFREISAERLAAKVLIDTRGAWKGIAGR